MKPTRHITLLCADDDADDRLLVKDALAESHVPSDLRFVADGEELMDYLHRRGAYADPETSPRPQLLLLDLNMPRMDGREAIAEIRADPVLRTLPVVVLTTSDAREDIEKVYALGANSYVVKPTSFEALVGLVSDLGRYWLEVVELPPEPLQ
jgi:CheY-like chemotaxis protein